MNGYNAVNNDLSCFAWEFLTTFIGGDLVNRLESSEIFLNNFREVQIDETKYDLGQRAKSGILEILEQVRMHRNDLSHAHLVLLSPIRQAKQIRLFQDLEVMQQKAGISTPEKLLHNRFKPMMQLCWATFILTDTNQKLRSDLKTFIANNLEKFEKYLDLTFSDSDPELRQAAVIAKLTQLVQTFGKAYLTPMHVVRNDQSTSKDFKNQSFNCSQEVRGLGLFKQYYRNVRQHHNTTLRENNENSLSIGA